jgi:hypothetical protein
MAGTLIAIPAPLPGIGILQRLAPVDGVGSGLDADLVRGRALPTDVFRFDLTPQFQSPPMWGDATVAQYLFGV